MAHFDANDVKVVFKGVECKSVPVAHVTFDSDNCCKELDCGGYCRLAKDHEPPCSCPGDTDGPGTCPA